MTITIEKAQLNNQSILENFGLVEEMDAQSAEIISGGCCRPCPPKDNDCHPCPPKDNDCRPCPPKDNDCHPCPPKDNGCNDHYGNNYSIIP